ncbi:hypothetical protein [Streptomyces sp. NPDC005799]|uniref:hypothetical protein n=1 Tax=Streptomyces sp. NPDC005799 TaxID=3154678 RepID=UPI0033CC6F73
MGAQGKAGAQEAGEHVIAVGRRRVALGGLVRRVDIPVGGARGQGRGVVVGLRVQQSAESVWGARCHRRREVVGS